VPFLQVHTSRALSTEAKRALGFALATCYAEHMQTTHRIVNVGFVRYDDGDIARFDAAGDGAQEMAVVTCDVRAGRSPEAHEALGRAITGACAHALELPEERIAVYITEHAAHHIYRDGGRAPEWSRAEAVSRTPSG
jgi:phenylpyruvate tautomerase PptA (4-oxalocrotonate tautomerase family)